MAYVEKHGVGVQVDHAVILSQSTDQGENETITVVHNTSIIQGKAEKCRKRTDRR